MKRNTLPPVEYLEECFSFDKDTGLLFWKERPRHHFSSDKGWKIANVKHAGKQAFTSPMGDGYYYSFFEGTAYAAHRVLWKLVTRQEPPDFIDHVDQDISNNCWSNLREATQSQNFINRSGSWGKVGIAGIRGSQNGKKWIARIQKDRRYVHIGTFGSKHEAIAARNEVAKQLYGDFVP